jgi:hypothetical protein
MRRGEQSPDRKALQKCWGRWAKIVEVFARRRVSRKRVDPRAYAELHHELMRNCRALAASANDVDATFYRYLEQLVQPWLNLDVLARGERDILFDLLIRCRDVEAQIRGRPSIRSFLVWMVPAAVGALFFAIMILWMREIPLPYSEILHRARGWTDELWFDATHASSTQWLCFVGCALIGISVYLVSRTARS